MKRYWYLAWVCWLASPLAGAEANALVAGTRSEAGFADGVGPAARLNDPSGMARDSLGNLYVCDSRNHVIRKIAPGGVVTTIAGKAGEAGAMNGSGLFARFHFPSDLTMGPNNTIYVADTGNHCIRVISPLGVVTTLAGDPGHADDIDRSFGATYRSMKINIDGKGRAARFQNPSGIVYAPAGFLYVSDTGNQLIRKVSLKGSVSTVAGKAGEWGSIDATGSRARFSSPRGLCIGSDGSLYIADSRNHTIRRMNSKGQVTTFAGNARESGRRDGLRLDARFCEPTDITPHPLGGFMVCDAFANSIHRINQLGMVSDIADADLEGLSHPSAVVCDASGNVYVADTFHQEIRLLIEKFGISIERLPEGNHLLIRWDSIVGRSYQLQMMSESGWVNAPVAPVRATTMTSQITLTSPPDAKQYRVQLLGF
jgi:sugar lactone lactonase YvrE